MALDLLREGKPARLAWIDEEHKPAFKALNLLTSKPVLYVCNVDEASAATGNAHSRKVEAMVAEQEKHHGAAPAHATSAAGAWPKPPASSSSPPRSKRRSRSLPEAEQREFLETLGLDEPGLDRLIRAGYELLDLVTFFTVGPKEARAWTVPTRHQGAAGGRRHPHRFRARLHPRADDRLRGFRRATAARSAPRTPARRATRARTMSSQDGDVMLFKFNV